MATTRQKVKTPAPKRMRLTLEKNVTLRLKTVIEVDVPGEINRMYGPSARAAVRREVKAALTVERQCGYERQWSTEKVDPNDEFSIDWASLQEIEAHITTTEKNTG